MNLIDINNIDCTKLPKKLYPYMKDIIDFFDVQPTVEAIPKADYETRLKADLEAILVELQLEIEELRLDRPLLIRYGHECYGLEDKKPTEIQQECSDIIQEKINKLKADPEGWNDKRRKDKFDDIALNYYEKLIVRGKALEQEPIDYKAKYERFSKKAEIVISQLREDRDRLLDVLDKIKEDFIARYPRNYAGGLELGGRFCVFSLNDILRTIDKYKEESEKK